MVTQQIAIETVTRLSHELQSTGIHLRKVILYGSFARGEQHEWSDIDVALVADEFTGFGYANIQRIGKVLVKPAYRMIEPKTYSTSYFEKGDAFIDEIMKNGLEIELQPNASPQ